MPDRPILSARTGLIAILAIFVLLASVYSLTTPLFEASDELWHYPMVQYMAEHGLSIPVQNSAQPGPWRQEGGQPPLYYMIGAAATFWIDTADMAQVRRINPHADIGIVVPDGNANMVAHDADRESFPWSGTALAMHMVRGLSILMGLGTVFLTYCLGRELFPRSTLIALGTAAFTAFNPMFLFISAVINNDNLSTLLATAILLLIVRLVKRREAPPLREYVIMGAAAGAGMLAKFQIGFLLPLIAVALLIVSIRARNWRPVVIGGAISGGLTILIAGWWYWRNYDLYGDATGINVFLDIVGRRAVPADLTQLWTERETFMMSFWGLFGGVNIPMNDGIYRIFNIITVIGIVGLIAAIIAGIVTGRRKSGVPAAHKANLAALLVAIWPVIVVVSLISWTRQTWASQGRLWFSAIAPLTIGLAAGLAWWGNIVHHRGHREHREKQERETGVGIVLGAAGIFFVGVAAITPFATIRPAYRLDREAYWSEPTLESGAQHAACFSEPGAESDALCMAFQQLDGAIRPGEVLKFSPALTVTGPLTRDWSLFIHLVDEDGLIEAQRDVYPGGGLIATSDLTLDDSWNNLIAVEIPKGLYTPQTLSVYLGFYHLPTRDRMIASGPDVDSATNRVYLGQVRLEAPRGSVPNPVNVNFGGVVRLLGYEVSDRSLAPGEQTTITLYWEALKAIEKEYVVSIQIIDPATFTKAAQEDRPSATPWERHHTSADPRTLTIAPEAIPGSYRVLVRVYPADDPARTLRVRGDTGVQSEDFVWLSWIQVKAP
jgi:4-amino-4-deoxy-L-arabinose transferase-like glycosyltransferase